MAIATARLAGGRGNDDEIHEVPSVDDRDNTRENPWGRTHEKSGNVAEAKCLGQTGLLTC
ncbi:unnamed protein product [Fusarium graminearum]|nr:unnamed protein product [Fusarium graminearum]